MQVKAQRGNYRIVDDAPMSLRMDGVGLYAIEELVKALDEQCGWWKQVYPESGKCTTDYEEVTRVFNQLTK